MAPVEVAPSLLQQLDAQLEVFFSGWNGLSTVLVVAVALVAVSPLLLNSEPDVHPFLLGRQGSGAPVRQPGESAVYRSSEVPHGYPLRSGLNVKDEGTPPYVAGRDGDLRDIWRKAAAEETDQKIISVRGRDIVQKRSPKELTKEIVAVGSHLEAQGAKKVLVMLHNSTELLLIIFAGAFYGFTPILVSPARYNEAILAGIIKHTEADALIAPAGVLPPAAVEGNKGLKCTIWVVEPNSRHLDFSEISEDLTNAFQWHDIVEKSKAGGLPSRSEGLPPSGIVFLQAKTSSGDTFDGDFIQFPQANIAAAVASQVSGLPRNHKMQPIDLALSLESLADQYPLVVTLAALWSGASIALITAAGGSKVDFDLALSIKGLTPSIVIASSAVMARAHSNKIGDAKGLVSSMQRSSHARALASGTMKLVDKAPATRTSMRLVYVSESPAAAGDSVPLSGPEITDLRFLTRSRIIYALVVPRVAGALAQTNMLDYRNDTTMSTRSHFGPPLSSVELKLIDTATSKISDDNVKGEITASGPAVLGGEVNTGLLGTMRDDGTLALV